MSTAEGPNEPLDLGMMDPRVTKRVREDILPTPPGPQPWQRPLKELFGTVSQREMGLRMVEHVKAARTIQDLEPTLNVYSYDPPIGFHLVIVDPVSRAAHWVWEHEVPDRAGGGTVVPPELWRELVKCVGRDRTPEGYIKEVPISELL